MIMLEEKENYKYLGILEANSINQTEMEEKIFKKNLRIIRKLLKTKLFKHKSYQWNKLLSSPPCKILWSILKMEKGQTQTNGRRTRKLMSISRRKMIDSMCQGKKEKEDSSALRLCRCINTRIGGIH